MESDTTIELVNTQTKVSGKLRRRKTLPLICPKLDFTSVFWDLPLNEDTRAFIEGGPLRSSEEKAKHRPWWKEFLSSHRLLQDANKKMDFLLPVPASAGASFQKQPINNNQARRWLRDLLSQGYERRGVEPPEGRIKSIALPSIRVFGPDTMYTVGIPPGVRQNLGRWMTISSTETYTRDHRTAITTAWDQTIQRMKEGKLPSLDPERRVPLQPFQAGVDERRDTLARPGSRNPMHRLREELLEEPPETSTSSSSTAAALPPPVVVEVPHTLLVVEVLLVAEEVVKVLVILIADKNMAQLIQVVVEVEPIVVAVVLADQV